jgi:hypothetical protein
MVVAGHHQRKGEPGAKERVLDRVVESEASSLLVILHYLLKNNTPFMGGNVQVKVSLPIPSTLPFHGGDI